VIAASVTGGLVVLILLGITVYKSNRSEAMDTVDRSFAGEQDANGYLVPTIKKCENPVYSVPERHPSVLTDFDPEAMYCMPLDGTYELASEDNQPTYEIAVSSNKLPIYSLGNNNPHYDVASSY
jgi:hypothetical protein